jgi:hypothetical protein
MTPINNVADAEKRIHAHAGAPEEFTLPISNGLLDPVGINMAIITDWILARGWEPDGFVQHEEYRLFRYRAASTETPLER